MPERKNKEITADAYRQTSKFMAFSFFLLRRPFYPWPLPSHHLTSCPADRIDRRCLPVSPHHLPVLGVPGRPGTIHKRVRAQSLMRWQEVRITFTKCLERHHDFTGISESGQTDIVSNQLADGGYFTHLSQTSNQRLALLARSEVQGPISSRHLLASLEC